MKAGKEDYLGKTIHVGLTFNLKDSDEFVQHQIHGRITSIRDDGLMEITKPDGDVFIYPFDEETLKPAEAGLYRETSTGAEIENPAYLSFWSIDDAYPELIEQRVRFGFADFVRR